MADTDPVSVIASTRTLVHADRFDILVHALAQLPDHVVLRLVGTGPDLGRIRRLVDAYQLGGRVTYSNDAEETDVRGATLIFPSAWNVQEAPLRPGADGRAIALAGSASLPSGTVRAKSFGELLSLVSEPARGTSSDRVLERNDDFRGERIAVLTNVPAHYRIPLFNAVAARVAAGGGEFRVLFLARTSGSRTWIKGIAPTFSHEFVRSHELPVRENGLLVPTALGSRLRDFAPSVVIIGSFSPLLALPAARYASTRRAALGVWSGEIPSRPTAKSRVRRWQRKLVLGQAHFALAYGKASADYLETMAADVPTVIVRNTTPVDGAPKKPTGELKRILTVGRAYPGKALDIAIAAVRLLDRKDIRLTIVGDGPELPRLRTLAASDDRIRFEGAVGTDRILDFYRNADVFLFPSRYDIFGHVLVEAMALGIATLVSSNPGAVEDLAVSEVNSLVIPEENPTAWASALRRVLDDDMFRARLGEAARHTIQSRWTMAHSTDAWIAGLRLGVDVARQRREPRA